METTNQQFVTYPEKWPKIQFLSQKIRLWKNQKKNVDICKIQPTLICRM